MYDFYPDAPRTKGDLAFELIFGAIVVLIMTFVLWTIVWLLAGLRSDEHCIDTQTVTEVQATGHRQVTDYYVKGDKGGVVQSRAITKTGDQYCFATSTDNYYKFRNYFKPWDNN